MALAKAETDGDKARPLLLSAGLNLMRVAAQSGPSDEVPNALLAAGEVNELLKNTEGAKAAYSGVVAKFGNSPAAPKAREALKRLGG